MSDAVQSPVLVLGGVRVEFGRKSVLAGLDLTVGANELLIVLGATGVGKTTLLRTIAGLQTPTAGTVAIAGEEMTHAPPGLRDVALVFQNFSLYPGWSVRRNLAFPLRAPGRSLSETAIEERVTWAARLLHIEGLLDKPAERLSGGQMQRVAIGRALVRRPRIFLFDEPLTNLDAKLREELRVELALLRRQLGIPMIYVTHDRSEALALADRIAVLADGVIAQIGSSESVWNAPVTPAVAALLGRS